MLYFYIYIILHNILYNILYYIIYYVIFLYLCNTVLCNILYGLSALDYFTLYHRIFRTNTIPAYHFLGVVLNEIGIKIVPLLKRAEFDSLRGGSALPPRHILREAAAVRIVRIDAVRQHRSG